MTLISTSSRVRRQVQSTIQTLYIAPEPSVLTLIRANYSGVRTLDMNTVDLTANDCKLLGQGDWPQLTSLDIQNNRVKPQGLRHVVKGRWPLLKVLNVASNGLDTKAVAKLTTAKWPLLEDLDLSANSMQPQGISHLLKANWPLKALRLASTCTEGTAIVTMLVKGDLPLLEELSLNSNEIDPPGNLN